MHQRRVFEYWSYMLVYVDDCLLINHGPGPAIEELNKEYRFEERRVRTARSILGSDNRFLYVYERQYLLVDVSASLFEGSM